MRKIKLIPDVPFFNSCDATILDVTDGERKRGKITIEYAKVDVQQLQRQGLDYEGALDYYKDRIDKTVRLYIAGDWTCIAGHDELMTIIEEHVKPYYDAPLQTTGVQNK